MVVVVTDHSAVDYARVGELAGLVVDTRGVMRRVEGSARVLGLAGAARRPEERAAAVAAD